MRPSRHYEFETPDVLCVAFIIKNFDMIILFACLVGLLHSSSEEKK